MKREFQWVKTVGWKQYLREEYIQNKHSYTYNLVDFDVFVQSFQKVESL